MFFRYRWSNLVAYVVNFFKMIRLRKATQLKPKYDYEHKLLFERIQKVRDDFEFNKKIIERKWREL